MKRKMLIFVILLLVVILTAAIYIRLSCKRIDEIGRFKIDDITKISFQYDNVSIKGGTVEDKEKISAFMKYVCSCVLTKKLIQPKITGYYQAITFYAGDKKAMCILTYDNFIDINGIKYKMVRNKLDLKRIDNFINSIK